MVVEDDVVLPYEISRVYLIHQTVGMMMKCRCAWQFRKALPRGSRDMPLFYYYIHREKVCVSNSFKFSRVNDCLWFVLFPVTKSWFWVLVTFSDTFSISSRFSLSEVMLFKWTVVLLKECYLLLICNTCNM